MDTREIKSLSLDAVVPMSEGTPTRWEMHREEVLQRRESRVVVQNAEDLLASLSLYDAETLFSMRTQQPWAMLGQELWRVLSVLTSLSISIGAAIILVAIPWALVGVLLDIEALNFYHSGAFVSFGVGSIGALVQVLRRRRQGRARALASKAQSDVLFQCLTRILPFARRSSRARLLEEGGILLLELGLRGGFGVCVQVHPKIQSVFMSLHHEDEPWKTYLAQHVPVSDGLADVCAKWLQRLPLVPVATGHSVPSMTSARLVRSQEAVQVWPESTHRTVPLRHFAPVALAQPRPTLLRRLGLVRVFGFWSLCAATLALYAAWFVPALVGNAPQGFDLGFFALLGGVLALLLSLERPKAPRHRARPVVRRGAQSTVRVVFDGRWLSLKGTEKQEGAVDLERPFVVHLTRQQDPHRGSLLGLQVTQGGRAKIVVCVPAQVSLEAESLERLDIEAGVMSAEDFTSWLWPLLQSRASLHGAPLAWSAQMEGLALRGAGGVALDEVDQGVEVGRQVGAAQP